MNSGNNELSAAIWRKLRACSVIRPLISKYDGPTQRGICSAVEFQVGGHIQEHGYHVLPAIFKLKGVSMHHRQTRRNFVAGISMATIGLVWSAESALADVGGAEAAAKRSRVIGACTRRWPDNQGDCSAFVREVAQDVGFVLNGNANAIYTQIAKDPWVRIGVGTQASATAGITAGEGKFVVAAEQSEGNGHVAIVVDYRNAFDSYAPVDRDKAVAFWGKLHSVGKEYERITRSWTAADLERVLFAYQVIT